MKSILMMSMSAAALLLAACGNGQESASAPAANEANDTAAAIAAEAQAGLTALEIAAEDACRADSEAGVLAVVPQGASFASRGPDGVVTVAWKLDGEGDVLRFDAPGLPEAFRSDFDFAVAEHMRHGLRPGDDRSGTGVYRMRDGRFCAIQTDRQVSEAVRAIAREAEAIETGTE